ncbi:carbohydrate kinase family protein [Isoptericola sp. NEAU-Y5]|uniref:Carbohydrate kinase family protein n=1 Tax=Isoptericola luteus TaxID=2879484 RepID=A0ABS7ZDU3_9MICO|nr:carbohydrate kinase family protein [Isoptericola sp. NEAU-Y5]MCA5891994.1 carbohydrate kinase family protein [Isoptericola sp. NEAU-Y5]
MISPHVLVAGPASWNRVVHVDTLPEPTPHTTFARDSYDVVGGTSAGKALNLSRLGRTVVLRTVLGDDDEGRRVREALAGGGVGLIVEPSPDGRTESHLNLMDGDGGRLSVYLRAPGAVPASGPGWAATLAALDDAEAVVVDLALPALPVLTAAFERGRDVWVDLHDYDGSADFHRPWVEAGSHLFLSSDRLADHRAFMAARLDAGARLVVCTHGARGATALDADGFVDVPAVAVPDVVDTNGAGDGFFAAFLDAHLSGAGVGAAMRAAAAHAADVVRGRGLAPGA